MKRTTLEDFIAGCRKSHGDFYDYSLIREFLGMAQKVSVVCPRHGRFDIRALKHYYGGQGCAVCALEKKGDRTRGSDRASAKSKFANFKSKFLSRAMAVHGDLYDYSQTEYTGAKQSVTVICPRHGPFKQLAWRHLGGRGCWSCGQKSAQEEEIWQFVSALAPESVRRDRTVVAPKELDVWVPGRQVAIEYCGHYWHSTLGLSTKEARRKHIDKYRVCADQGIRLLTIFEDEWTFKRFQVESLLKRAVKAEAGVGARSCTITVDADFKGFLDRHHIQGRVRSGICAGLVLDDALVAVMSFNKGNARRGSKDWELSRYATDRPVMGGASRLFKYLLRQTGAGRVWSYSDNRYFDGSMYLKLGFKLDGELAPDYSVVRKGRRMHKASFRRDNIPARIRESGSNETFDPATDPRSELDMTKLLGFGRIYDCGKKRWLYETTAAHNHLGRPVIRSVPFRT